MMGQRGFQAHVGRPLQLVRDQERVRLHAPPRLGENVYVPTKPHDLARRLPPRELTADVGGIPIPREQEAPTKDRQVRDRIQELCEFHGANMPDMANTRNGLSAVDRGRASHAPDGR